MDKPVRKIIRLDNYDYSKNGLYFITICTIDKNELLWATDVGDGAPDVPLCCAHAVGKVYLSSFGKIIRDNIHRANSVYDDKKILQYVIMPNHIHFILKIGAGVSGTSRAPSPTNEIVPQYVSMLKRFINKDIMTASSETKKNIQQFQNTYTITLSSGTLTSIIPKMRTIKRRCME